MQNTINWNKIYLEFSPKLLGICRRYVDNQAAAEDILQDSFLTAIQKSDQLRSYASVFPWLKKIVINNSLLYLRSKEQKIFTVKESEFLQEIPSQMIYNTPEDYNNILGYDFSTEELLSSIDQLSPQHKSVFNLYFFEKYSHAEIAKTLGININTSKSNLLRAKKSVQQFLMKNSEAKKSSAMKKNGIKILVFLGFGNLLWAQAFRSKFNGFFIMPEKHFEVSTEQLTLTESSKKNILTRVFMILALISGIVFFGLQSNVTGISSYFSGTEQKTEENSKLKTENTIKPKEKISEEIHKPAVINEKEVSNAKNVSSLEKNTEEPKTVLPQKIKESKPAETPAVKENIIKATPVPTTKDTALVNKERKKVIIVKKIIKRDTVYIER